jgi:hypothetical protein
VSEHTCHATGCQTEVPPKLFMCRKHWFRLPKEMRDLVWENYVPGQEIRKDPTPEYLNIVQRCIRFIERAEAAP